MSNIWQDPFGLKLIKPNQRRNPPPPPPPAPAEHPKVQYYYTVPCYQMPMAQQFIYSEITYTQIIPTPFCHQVEKAPAKCHCNHKKPEKKPDKKDVKKVDEKKKKKEEAQKKKEKELAKEKADRENVVRTFSNPRVPRKGVFER